MNARILIVEDEEPLTMLLRYNLEAEGSEVETSADHHADCAGRGK
jgi:two-component system phosphate regulon response regulator PhoB